MEFLPVTATKEQISSLTKVSFQPPVCIDFETFSGEMHKGLNKNTWTSNYIYSSQNLYFVILIRNVFRKRTAKGYFGKNISATYTKEYYK